MIFKLVGGGLVLAVGYAISVRLNRNEEKKLCQITSLAALFRFFRTQIDLYCVPVGEIFCRCDTELLRGCGYSFAVPPQDFGGFVASLDPPPNENLSPILDSFETQLGSSYKDEQLKSIDYHIARITELCELTAGECSKKKRLCTTLCVSAAALIVIMLI